MAALWGKVLVDGVDACLEQVKAGFAWHYKKYQHEQSAEDRRLYAQAEGKAGSIQSFFSSWLGRFSNLPIVPKVRHVTKYPNQKMIQCTGEHKQSNRTFSKSLLS